MKRRRKLLLFFGLPALLFVLAAALVDSQTYGRFLAGKLQHIALESGNRVSFENPRLSLGGLRADAATWVSGKAPVAVHATDIRVAPSLLTLFNSTLGFTFEGTLYGGALHGSIQQQLTGDNLTSKITLSKMQLADHPQLQGFGVTAGTLSVKDLAFTVQDDKLLSASGDIALEELEKSGMSVLPGPGTPLIIPELEKLSLQMHLTYTLPEIDLDALKISSPLGELNGQITLNDLGKTHFSQPESIMLKGSATAQLSAKGHTLLGPLVTSFAGLKDPIEKDSELTVELRGSLGKPRTVIQASQNVSG